MNILLIGGFSSLMNQLIIKLKKERHRIYLITGNPYDKTNNPKVFETYRFSYDNVNLNEVFESVNPDVTVFLGAFDVNFDWEKGEKESVRFSTSFINLLVSFSAIKRGRFIFLSSDEVYSGHYDRDIEENTPFSSSGCRAMSLAQAEYICEDYRRNYQLDLVVLRLDHLYHIPQNLREADNICARMCLEAMQKRYITTKMDETFSLLYESDAVEFISKVILCTEHQHSLYHISSGVEISQTELAEKIRDYLEVDATIVEEQEGGGRRVLSNYRFDHEFGMVFFQDQDKMIRKLVTEMKKKESVFSKMEENQLSWWKRIFNQWKWFLLLLIPYIENMICFIPFFMLNNRTVDSEYFSQIDFFLIYVLLFAVIYGQQQAIFSSILSLAGYLFRQMYTKSEFEVMIDYTTYVWIAQLFIVGLVVGYMRDQIRSIKTESEELEEHLLGQIKDIKEINGSNRRVKDVLERQVIDQKDSIGKIYSITSKLDQVVPDEVLFDAVEMLTQILQSKDVAIYTVGDGDYARMFSASSHKARELGNSIQYKKMGEMYQDLMNRKVYINRALDQQYPLMANAIFEEDKMRMIIMVWGISWDRMTLGQANLLTVVSYLIQNAVLRANRYMSALEEKRYVEDTRILEPEAFSSLVDAYQKAKKRNLTECTLLHILEKPEYAEKAAEVLKDNLRQSDYMGKLKDGELYVLLSNTNHVEAGVVVHRFLEHGYQSEIMEKIRL